MAGTSVTDAVAPALPSDWLTVDTTAAQRGNGPADYGNPAADPVPNTVPQAGPPDELHDTPVFVTPSTETQYEPDGSGAWPELGYGGLYPQPAIDRGYGTPQGVNETILPSESQDFQHSGMWADTEILQTYDASYQQTDTHGWDLTVPNDRVSARNSFGQDNPDNNPTWYDYGENQAQGHLALTASNFTSDAGEFGTPGVGNGSLPTWDMLGGQGNLAYETPPPPPVASTDQLPSQIITDPGMGWA